MIITIILELLVIIISPFFTIIGSIFKLTGISAVMDGIQPFIDTIFKFGTQLMWLLLDLEFTKYLLGIVLVIETGIQLYKIVMWIIKKIPFLGIQ